jgi:hypothetical protein
VTPTSNGKVYWLAAAAGCRPVRALFIHSPTTRPGDRHHGECGAAMTFIVTLRATIRFWCRSGASAHTRRRPNARLVSVLAGPPLDGHHRRHRAAAGLRAHRLWPKGSLRDPVRGRRHDLLDLVGSIGCRRLQRPSNVPAGHPAFGLGTVGFTASKVPFSLGLRSCWW